MKVNGLQERIVNDKRKREEERKRADDEIKWKHAEEKRKRNGDNVKATGVRKWEKRGGGGDERRMRIWT